MDELVRRRLIDSITHALPHPLLRESLQRAINSQALAEKSPSLDLPYLASMQTFWGYIYVAQGRFDEALNWIDLSAPVGSGLDVEMMRGVIKGMALLGNGDRETCRRHTSQFRLRARQTGFLVYAVEAERLLALIEKPPPVNELVQRVCCG